ncbi:unnamed protein product [Adineta steineri]|uniref:Uncharacterized protein n=1 Tax=Adineta steineri TaxID=433720 RepID=A0A814L157_9BILA|nr:unnamed protein product [Adineta steineri]CAF4212532.1 unnamed protein product [Adineta steineri]
MIKTSHPHLSVLNMVSILLLLFTIANCNNNNNNDDQLEAILLGNRPIHTTEQLYNLLDQANLSDEDTDIIVRDSFKPYPARRASFHAMRGKRRAILP